MLFLPQEKHIDEKIKRVGLCEALVQFTSTFKPDKPCECFHTLKTRQIFLNSEGNFWSVITLSIPHTEKTSREGTKSVEYHDDDVQNSVLRSVLRQAYSMFKLFNGSLTYIRRQHGVEALKERLAYFYTRYLQTLNFGQFDVLDVYHGINFSPLDRSAFLKVQSIMNMITTNFKHINDVALLHDDQLVWTTLGVETMRILYKYLVTSLFPAAVESETVEKDQGKASSQVPTMVRLTGGRYLTIPMDVMAQQFGNPKRAPRVFIECGSDHTLQFHLVVYRAGPIAACFLVDAQQQLGPDYYVSLNASLGVHLCSISSIIGDQAHKKTLQYLNDQQYRFVYFNRMNLAVKTSIHARKSSQMSVSSEMMRLLIDTHQDFDELIASGEVIMKTISDCWVVGRRAENREFFVVLNQKNANLVEVNDEIRKLVSGAFGNLFCAD